MRDYAKVSPKFWTGETGQDIARRGSEALVVAMYLMTSPHSNMLGLYYQPILYLAEETGLSPEGASKGLQQCMEAGFCDFDPVSKMVWVFEMASYQIGSELKSDDKRCKGIQKDYDALPNTPFLGPFFDRYAPKFNLTKRREFTAKPKAVVLRLVSPFEAPPKPGEGAGEGEGTGIVSPSAPAAPAPAAPTPAVSKTPTPDPKGARLPADWTLPPEWAAWCSENRPDLEPQKVADGFKDFWIGKAGKDGRKADWLATWRNWCRSQKPGNRVPGSEASFV